MTKHPKVIIALLISVLAWGSTFAVIKIGLGSIHPYTLAIVRGVISSVFLFGIVLITNRIGELKKMIRENLIICICLGATGLFFMSLLQNIGLSLTSSALGSVLFNTNPLITLVLAIFILKEKLNIQKFGGALIGFLGIIVIVLLVGDINNGIGSQTLLGNILMIGAGASWSVYSLIGKKVTGKYSALVITFATFLFGTLLLLPLTLTYAFLGNLYVLDTKSYMVFIYYSLIGSVLPFILWNYALNKIEVSKAAVFLYLIPVVSIIIGLVFLKEIFTLFQFFGSMLVLLGIYLTERKKIINKRQS